MELNWLLVSRKVHVKRWTDLSLETWTRTVQESLTSYGSNIYTKEENVKKKSNIYTKEENLKKKSNIYTKEENLKKKSYGSNI